MGVVLCAVQVIAQTKAALGDMGVNTKALESAAAASGSAAAAKSVARSSSTLLVKNLPYGADSDELQQLFTGPGRSVLRLVLPPTNTLAVVEFAEPQDAR
jgi:multiple RNA-binding domain-containing protein 1